MSEPNSKERILAAAAASASLEGLDALTLGKLATQTGLSKSNVVERFGSLEDLRLATIEHAVTIFDREVIAPAGRFPPGGMRLEALADGWMDYVRRRVFPGGCFLTRVATEHAGRQGAVADAARRHAATWTDALAQQARTAGMPDPNQVAYEVVALGTPAVLDAGQSARRRALKAIHQRIAG